MLPWTLLSKSERLEQFMLVASKAMLLSFKNLGHFSSIYFPLFTPNSSLYFLWNWLLSYPTTNATYVGTAIVPIKAPATWSKNSSIKTKCLFFKTSFKASKIKDLLNLEWINSRYLSKQYLIDLNPNSYGILVYKLIKLKDTSFLLILSCIFLWDSQNHLFYITFNFGQKRLEKNVDIICDLLL